MVAKLLPCVMMKHLFELPGFYLHEIKGDNGVLIKKRVHRHQKQRLANYFVVQTI